MRSRHEPRGLSRGTAAPWLRGISGMLVFDPVRAVHEPMVLAELDDAGTVGVARATILQAFARNLPDIGVADTPD